MNPWDVKSWIVSYGCYPESIIRTDSLMSKVTYSVFKTLQDQNVENGPYTTASVVYMEDAGSIIKKTTGIYREDASSIIKKFAEESMRKVRVIEHGGNSMTGVGNAL
jgi:hypothetical protein